MAMRRRFEVAFPNAAGIDVGASSHYVAVSIGNIKGLVIWCNGQHGGHGIGIVAAAQLRVIFPAKFPMGFARNS